MLPAGTGQKYVEMSSVKGCGRVISKRCCKVSPWMRRFRHKDYNDQKEVQRRGGSGRGLCSIIASSNNLFMGTARSIYIKMKGLLFLRSRMPGFSTFLFNARRKTNPYFAKSSGM